MGDLGATLIKELNCETAFTIGGIGISESVVVTWIMMAVVLVVSLIVTHGLKVEHPGRGQLLLENAVTWPLPLQSCGRTCYLPFSLFRRQRKFRTGYPSRPAMAVAQDRCPARRHLPSDLPQSLQDVTCRLRESLHPARLIFHQIFLLYFLLHCISME